MSLRLGADEGAGLSPAQGQPLQAFLQGSPQPGRHTGVRAGARVQHKGRFSRLTHRPAQDRGPPPRPQPAAPVSRSPPRNPTPDPPSRLRPQQGGGQAAVCSGVAQAGRRRQAKRRARTGGLLWELLFLPFRPLGLPRAPGFAFRILLSCFQEACRAPEKQAAAGVTGRAWAGVRSKISKSQLGAVLTQSVSMSRLSSLRHRHQELALFSFFLS